MKNVLFHHLVKFSGYDVKYSDRFGSSFVVIPLDSEAYPPIRGHHITVFEHISNGYDSKDAQYHYTFKTYKIKKTRIYFNSEDTILKVSGKSWPGFGAAWDEMGSGMTEALDLIKIHKKGLRIEQKVYEYLLDGYLQILNAATDEKIWWNAYQAVMACDSVSCLFEDGSTFIGKLQYVKTTSFVPEILAIKEDTIEYESGDDVLDLSSDLSEKGTDVEDEIVAENHDQNRLSFKV